MSLVEDLARLDGGAESVAVEARLAGILIVGGEVMR